MRHIQLLPLILFSLALIVPVEGSAARVPPGKQVIIKPTQDKMWDTTGVGDVAVRCADYAGKKIPIDVKGKKIYSVPNRLKELAKLIKAETSPSKLKKLKKENTRLKTYNRNAKAVCLQGPPPAVTPTPVPTPTPEPFAAKTSASTEGDVRYLYEKAGLGAVPAEAMSAFQAGGISAVVDYMAAYQPEPELTTQAALMLDNDLTNDTPVNGVIPAQGAVNPEGLQLYALHHLLQTKNPFHMRLAFIFLHNMLATSSEVLQPVFQQNQYPMFREHLDKLLAHAVSGDYRNLVKEITVDGAMLHWLDGRLNIKQEPNENFARELHELFTMSPHNRVTGEDNYTEVDVSNAALALAGYTTTFQSIGGGQGAWGVAVRSANVFTGSVTMYAGTAAEHVVQAQNSLMPAAAQVVDAAIDHPGTRYYLAFRLLNDYVVENPSVEYVQALGDFLAANNYNIVDGLKKVLNSEWFYQQQNRNARVIMPTERIVQFLRRTKIPYNIKQLRSMDATNGGEVGGNNGSAGMVATGNVITMPRTVFGWDNLDFANSGWQLALINTITKITSNDNYFNQMVNGQPRFRYKALFPPGNTNPQDYELINYFQQLCNVTNISETQRQALLNYMNDNAVCPGGGAQCTVDSINLLPQRFDARCDGTTGVCNNNNIVREKVAGLVNLICFLHPDTQFG